MVIWVGQDRVRIAYSTIGRTFLIMSTAPAGSSLREYMRYAATIVALLPVGRRLGEKRLRISSLERTDSSLTVDEDTATLVELPLYK